MTALARHLLSATLSAGFALTGSAAFASGLQVSPVSLTLRTSQSADGLWLSNTGNALVHAQVRVYHWTQDDGKETLTASRGLVVSPPMLEIKPGDKQLIRVIRVGAPPNGDGAVEDAYRLAIDELPIDTHGKTGLQFVLHYSVPVFVEPVGTAVVAPQLQWTLRRDGEAAVLHVANGGNGHAQLAGLSFLDPAGHRIEINGGLLGYVLPGTSASWMLKPLAAVFAGGGTLEARVNGAPATQTILPVDRAR